MEWFFAVLRDHPWGWWLVPPVGLALFGAWLFAPFHWRDAEGSLVDDARGFAWTANHFWNPIRWFFWVWHTWRRWRR